MQSYVLLYAACQYVQISMHNMNRIHKSAEGTKRVQHIISASISEFFAILLVKARHRAEQAYKTKKRNVQNPFSSK